MHAQQARRMLDEVRQWAGDRAIIDQHTPDPEIREAWFRVADAADDLAIMIERLDARVTVHGG